MLPDGNAVTVENGEIHSSCIFLSDTTQHSMLGSGILFQIQLQVPQTQDSRRQQTTHEATNEQPGRYERVSERFTL